ncbi:septum formation family protein [Dactylosporangium sp. NPDC005555]|uniref:septum formation family protein n=1 Tax=Dactylosporangium sp. NPDC005555 TaxID=3154889 RepID=UPI0033A80F04
MTSTARVATTAVLATVLTGVLLAVSGCTLRPTDTDGDLVDDWRPLAAPVFDLPAVGTCLDGTAATTTFNPLSVRGGAVPCDREHTFEVVLVGTVEGSAAQRPVAPEADTEAGREALQAAYKTCSTAVDAYVGADWHTGLLGIEVRMPARGSWEGGLRSYLCTVNGLSDLYGRISMTTGSLKDSLAGAAPKAIRCLDVNGDKGSDGWWSNLNAMTAIDCAQPHEAEFVGTVQVGVGVGGALPDEEQLRKWTSERCWPVVAKFMGLTDAQLDSRSDIGIGWDGFDKAQWDTGDRTQRCVALFYPGKKVRASIKGLGKKALPV